MSTSEEGRDRLAPMADAEREVRACEQWVAGAQADLDHVSAQLAQAIELGHGPTKWDEEWLCGFRVVQRAAFDELAQARHALRLALVERDRELEGCLFEGRLVEKLER
jgi:hypothetical protein